MVGLRRRVTMRRYFAALAFLGCVRGSIHKPIETGKTLWAP
jgi:hypothetical protein